MGRPLPATPQTPEQVVWSSGVTCREWHPGTVPLGSDDEVKISISHQGGPGGAATPEPWEHLG